MDAAPQRPPLNPGLTPMESRAYADLGINPAETKIAGVDAEVERILAEQDAAAAAEFPVDPSTPPLDFDEERDATPWEKLSAEQRADLAEKLRDMRRLEAELDAARAASATLAPGVGAAIAAADAPPTLAADPPASPPSPPRGDDDVADDDSVEGGARRCPRCACDVDDPPTEEPTRMDWLSWLAGLQGARFRKEYAIYGGAVVLTFRSPTAEETGLAHLQAGEDELATVADYLVRVLEYEQALSLEKVTFANGEVRISPIDRLLGGEGRDGKSTNLPAILEYGKKHIYPNASLARLAHAQFRRFRRLIEWMEVNWEREDFTEEISSPA